MRSWKRKLLEYGILIKLFFPKRFSVAAFCLRSQVNAFSAGSTAQPMFGSCSKSKVRVMSNIQKSPLHGNRTDDWACVCKSLTGVFVERLGKNLDCRWLYHRIGDRPTGKTFKMP
jgi:hypothetical protein